MNQDKQYRDNKFKVKNKKIESNAIQIDFEKITEKSVLISHEHPVIAIDICQKRNLLASGSEEWTAKLWDLKDNSLIQTYDYGCGYVNDIVFSKEGNLMAFGGEGTYLIWLVDISYLGKQYFTKLCGHTYFVQKLTFSNNSKLLISASSDRTVRIWDCNSKLETFKLKLNSKSAVNGVAINADDTVIAANSENGKIRIWNLETEYKLCSHRTHGRGDRIKFSDNQKILASSNREGVIYLWNLKMLNQNKLELIRKLQVGEGWIGAVLFSPCSRYLISMSIRDSKIIILSTQTWEVVKEFKSNYERIDAFTISKNMDIIAYSERQKIVVLRMK